MFILDDDVIGGSVYVYSGPDNYGSSGYMHKTLVPYQGNLRIYGTGIASNYGIAAGAIVVLDGSTEHWRRMSDGTLVERRNAGFKAWPNELGYKSGGSEPTTLFTEETNHEHYYIIPEDVADYYTTPTIGGAQYKAKLMYMGNTNETKEASDWGKYITATGYSNWSDGKKTVTGYVCSAGPANIYSCINTDNSMGTVSAASAVDCSVRLIAKPTGAAPVITPEQTALGTITEPTSVTLQLVGSPAVTASWDGQQAETVQTNVGSVTIDLADKWESLSYGSHTIVVRSSQGGYQCGAMITFSKSSSVVEVVTTPHMTIERPTMVKVVGDLLVPSGAELTVDVSNNAGDDSPQWEPCGEDMTHYFANTTKTADQWGLAVRIGIDNSAGASNAEIRNSIAAGVIYDREE